MVQVLGLRVWGSGFNPMTLGGILADDLHLISGVRPQTFSLNPTVGVLVFHGFQQRFQKGLERRDGSCL